MSDDQPYRLSDHAREEAERRGISLDMLDAVMHSPGQIVNADFGRKAYQSQIEIGDKLYLVRVIVEQSDPPTVITVYRTSKIEKYWSENA